MHEQRRPVHVGKEAGIRARPLRFEILGAPYDGGTVTNPGARHGPEILRTLAGLCDGHVTGSDTVTGRTVDYQIMNSGDVVPLNLHPMTARSVVYSAIGSAIRASIGRGNIPVLVGGDHAISAPAIQAVGVENAVDLVVLDAHLDAQRSATDGWAYLTHANFIDHVRNDVVEITLVGVRELVATPLFEDPQFRFVPPDRIAEHEWEWSHRPVYLSIDMDVLDPAYFPATGHPIPGGLATAEVLSTIRRLLAVRKLAAVDIVEVMPDPANDQLSALTMRAVLETIFYSTRIEEDDARPCIDEY